MKKLLTEAEIRNNVPIFDEDFKLNYLAFCFMKSIMYVKSIAMHRNYRNRKQSYKFSGKND